MLVQDPRGQVMSGVALTLMAIGVYAINRIVRITL